MKLKNNIIILGIILFGIVSCNVLDTEPKEAVSSDHVIFNERSAQIALNGLYSQAQDVYGDFFLILSDISSDISQSVGTRNYYRAVDTYGINAANLATEGFWADAYEAINQANFIIGKVPDLKNVDQATKNKILGQAYFLRALLYFDLNRTFGGVNGVYGWKGVPLDLKATTAITKGSYPSRHSIDAVYAQVEADLKKAISLLEGAAIPIRASEAAAKALLSRLYLYYKQDYQLVEKYATAVIEDYNYKLTEDYASIFVQEQTVGSIFELNFTNSDGSNTRFRYFPPSEGGRGEVALHTDFAKLLLSRPDDERSKLIAYDKRVGVYYPTKYQKVSGKDNIQILRLAEMYLNRAEARVKQNPIDLSGALSDLNAVRNRAGLPDTTGAGVDTAEEIMDAIALGRKIEFFEEGKRWFFLTRTGRALSVLQNVDRKQGPPVSLEDPGRQVWPIPQRELDANPNIKQNPAYR